jgi:uncharacterized small protein (DUF1192 family)
MSKKKSAVEKAIDQLESEIAVLRAAIDRLKQQQKNTPARKPRVVASISA